MGARRPRVIIHTAVSADGRTDGFQPRVDVYYRLARSFDEDVTLTGADTILAASSAPEAAGPPSPPPSDGPLLAVTDSRGRVRDYGPLLGAGIWRGVLALCSDATPQSHLTHLAGTGIPAARCGTDRVDLAAALALLAAEQDAHTVRVDSGGRLNGALLRAGLVDEVSLLVHPVAVGGHSARSALVADDLLPGATGNPLAGPAVELLDEGLLWLRWTVSPDGRQEP